MNLWLARFPSPSWPYPFLCPSREPPGCQPWLQPWKTQGHDHNLTASQYDTGNNGHVNSQGYQLWPTSGAGCPCSMLWLENQLIFRWSLLLFLLIVPLALPFWRETLHKSKLMGWAVLVQGLQNFSSTKAPPTHHQPAIITLMFVTSS